MLKLRTRNKPKPPPQKLKLHSHRPDTPLLAAMWGEQWDRKAASLFRGQLVQFFLMCSYLYYLHDISLMSDHEYDAVCRRLDKEWDLITHPHKQFIQRVKEDDGSLRVKGMYWLKETEYPLMCRAAAWRLAEDFRIDEGKRPSNAYLLVGNRIRIKKKPVQQLRLRFR